MSGLALGIDGAAHEGGLAGPGSTVAFVGTGLDRVYPAAPRRARRSASPSKAWSPASTRSARRPLPDNFPRRNRLIAGIARGTLVVEAALESGSLITARLALEDGRDVFAIPGSIHSPQSRGCHRLIQEGAKLVETGDDVLRELRFGPVEARRATLSPAQPSLFASAADSGSAEADGPDDALRAALGHDPVTFDALAARTGLPTDQLAARLLELELTGVVAAAAGRPAAAARAGLKPRPRRPTSPSSPAFDPRMHSGREAQPRRCKSGPCHDDFTKVQQRPSPVPTRACRHRSLRYSGFMFDVLVYLYENYWRPDACPDHDQLSRKLTAVGFETDEIQEALHWLDGLADTSQGYTGVQSEDAIRLYSDREIESLGETSVGFVTFLESAGVLPPPMREMVIDRAMAAGGNPLDLDDMKIIILMVFWSLGEEPDALILDELFVAPEERLIH